jgi:hypothetical protein
MYNTKNDKYVCDFCGMEIGWDEHHHSHGDIYSCDICGKHFCSRCFKNKIGTDAYYQMIQSGNRIKCPDCVNSGYNTVADWINNGCASAHK